MAFQADALDALLARGAFGIELDDFHLAAERAEKVTHRLQARSAPANAARR